MKYFRMSYEEVTQKRSYINILLLNASIPQYHDAKEVKRRKEKDSEPKNATDYFMNLMGK